MQDDGFKVVVADQSFEPVLKNLFEFYLHDMAEWFRFDQKPEGNYTYTFEPFWGEDYEVYILLSEDIPIGFGLTGPADEWLPGRAATDMEEFFIVRRHRGTGLAGAFAFDLWQRHPGPWLVRVFQPNLPALPFWRKSIAQFSANNYEERVVEENGKPWSYFTFDSPQL